MIDLAHIRHTLAQYAHSTGTWPKPLAHVTDLLTLGAQLTSRHEFRGHITAGAVLVNHDGAVLHIRHKALGTWLRPGGHLEPEDTTRAEVPTDRVPFDLLPDGLRTAIEKQAGPVQQVHTIDAGFNSAISARVTTEQGAVFLKGLPADHPRIETLHREIVINAHVTHVSPQLLWHVQAEGWDVLAFEAINGPHADYTSDGNLPLVADTLTRLSQMRAPDGLDLRLAEQRLAAFAPAGALPYFAGDALAHTDPNPTNVLISGGRAVLVDWAWATRAAPWLDAAYWTLWLIADGHTPEAAEHWAARIPAFRTAPTIGLNAFASANEQLWAGIAADDPDPWTQRVHAAAKQWTAHRTRNS
ncbi:aminoglycoside phosphotransferase [Streptomyces luteolus]|uniref:Aminoglycoside phosphotransferase n=1 Tax=Streptomyces luteolus TaxID=3043615 RepID=A0ABT6T9R7_9ACTN|nr:aminoglycoside phosphotransferase [Streptomyces sp. B-S-A12]MDI3424118.1 aminoglycoside phosphotransferase [Streptomyces sp. B-S-A12]